MNRTDPETPDLAHRVETAMREFGERARSTPQRCRQLLNSRRRNALLRDLGLLHYEAHLDGTEADPDACQGLLTALEQAESASKRSGHR